MHYKRIVFLLELYGSFLFRFHNVGDLISQNFKYNMCLK